MIDIEIKKVLEEFNSKGLNKSEENETSFFDIAGFPHYENVMSNVLQFFFDTHEIHGFGDIWIKSLIEAYNDKVDTKVNTSDLDVQDVLREYSNGNDKRIDLLIRCDSLIIIIENKIYADASYNPLEAYNESASNYARDNGIDNPHFVRIILSVFEQDRNDCGFVNITYKELFNKLENNQSFGDTDNKWAVLANDFILNIKNRKRESDLKMDKEWMEFVENNGKDLANLYKRIENSIDDRVSILKTINDNLDGDLSTRKGVYNSKGESFISQFNDVHMKDGYNVCIETYMMKYATNKEYEDYDKLYVSLWCRRNHHYDFGYILKAINKENAYKRETTGQGSWGEHYILDIYSLDEELNIERIAQTIKDYIVKIDNLNKE